LTDIEPSGIESSTGDRDGSLVKISRVGSILPTFIQRAGDVAKTALAWTEVTSSADKSPSQLYQEKWVWGWNNQLEVWNGGLAVLGFCGFSDLNLISARPSACLGLL